MSEKTRCGESGLELNSIELLLFGGSQNDPSQLAFGAKLAAFKFKAMSIRVWKLKAPQEGSIQRGRVEARARIP
jgi:hypothetical protein